MTITVRTVVFMSVVFLIVVLIEWGLAYRRKFRILLREAAEPKHLWSFIRHQGGGTVISPKPMTELEALEFCRSLGAVMYVDRDKGFIFYRPKEG